MSSLVALGCPKPVAEVPDASTEVPLDAGDATDAGAEPVDAGPETLRFTLSFALADGGTLEADHDTAQPLQLDPASTLTLTFPSPLEDARVRVMDWTDAIVASDDEATAEPDAGFTYRITFSQPLKSGRSYSLLIDSEAHETFSDARGHVFDEVRLSLKVSGQVQPEPGAATKKKKRKK